MKAGCQQRPRMSRPGWREPVCPRASPHSPSATSSGANQTPRLRCARFRGRAPACSAGTETCVSLFSCDCRFSFWFAFSSGTPETASSEVILLAVFKSVAVLSSCWTEPVPLIKYSPVCLLVLIWSELLFFS